MPTFLSDPSPTLYLLLILVVVVTAAVAFRRQDRPSATWLAAAAGVLLALWLLDKLFEGPREEAVRKVNAMVAAMNDRSPDAFLAHVSDTFDHAGRAKKDALRNARWWGILRQYNVHVAAWDFARDDVDYPDDRSIRVGFLAKGEADGKPIPYYFQATFVKDADGQYRVRAVQAFDAVKRTNEKVDIPDFP